MAEEAPRTIYQPLHSAVRPRLDPEYIAFHEKYLQYIPSSESTPWDPACRTAASPSALGCSEQVPIDSIRDYPYRKYATPESVAEHREVNDQEKIRIFTPQRLPPSSGWPVLVWFHGGGWTMGGLNSENSFLTRICRDVQCVVASVNYRHAPEDPYPAAIDDCLEGYKWIVSEQGLRVLRIDAKRVAVGGLSAGGGLAAILSLKATHLNIPVPTFQLLLLPVIDNTATASTIWASNAHAPWLTPARMTWYRRMYLPNEEDWKKWDVSPNLAPKELLEKSPKTFIAVAECDILCEEGKAYGKSLSEVGVLVDVKEYKGSTHSLLILDGVLARGRELVIDATEALVQQFHKS